MIHFSLFGIPVAVQPFFWVTMVFLGGAFGADSPTEIFRLALFVIAGFISILVHEMGHALTIKAFGAPTSVTLEAFGGYATHPRGMLNRPQSFLVTAAGPAVQIILGILALLPLLLLTDRLLPPIAAANPEAMVAMILRARGLPPEFHAAYFLATLFLISLFWAILNLLPVLPLDGGQLVNALLGPSRIRVTLWITVIAAIAGGILMFLWMGMLMFPLMMGYFAYEAIKTLRAHSSWR